MSQDNIFKASEIENQVFEMIAPDPVDDFKLRWPGEPIVRDMTVGNSRLILSASHTAIYSSSDVIH